MLSETNVETLSQSSNSPSIVMVLAEAFEKLRKSKKKAIPMAMSTGPLSFIFVFYFYIKTRNSKEGTEETGEQKSKKILDN